MPTNTLSGYILDTLREEYSQDYNELYITDVNRTTRTITLGNLDSLRGYDEEINRIYRQIVFGTPTILTEKHGLPQSELKTSLEKEIQDINTMGWRE